MDDDDVVDDDVDDDGVDDDDDNHSNTLSCLCINLFDENDSYYQFIYHLHLLCIGGNSNINLYHYSNLVI